MTDNDYTAEDQRAVGWLGLGVTATSFVAMALASPGGEILAALKTGISVAELRPPAPFERTSGAWGDLRDQLEEYQNFVIGLTRGVHEGSDEDLWSGPGAKAMSEFVEDELTPAFTGLIGAAEDASAICEELAKHYEQAVEDWFYAAFEGIALLVVAKALLKIPAPLGPALNAAANLGIMGYGLFQDSTILTNLFADLNDSLSKSKDLVMAAEGLRHVLGEKGSSLDKPLETELDGIESELGDHDSWDKT